MTIRKLLGISTLNIQCESYVINILYKIEYIMNNTIDTLPVFKTDFLQTMRVNDFKKEQRNKMRNFKLEIDKILKNEVKGGLAALKFSVF